jgi:hypothetical protein
MPVSSVNSCGRLAGFESGIQRAVACVLVDPQFLFRLEREPAGIAAGTAYRLTDLDLASRLSFFLWRSIPDDQLREAAVRGALKDPAELERQVRRMLADPRADALVNNFAGQWLYLRELRSPCRFPDAMAPAQTPVRSTAASPKNRFACFYVPHGATMDKWTPAPEGTVLRSPRFSSRSRRSANTSTS